MSGIKNLLHGLLLCIWSYLDDTNLGVQLGCIIYIQMRAKSVISTSTYTVKKNLDWDPAQAGFPRLIRIELDFYPADIHPVVTGKLSINWIWIQLEPDLNPHYCGWKSSSNRMGIQNWIAFQMGLDDSPLDRNPALSVLGGEIRLDLDQHPRYLLEWITIQYFEIIGLPPLFYTKLLLSLCITPLEMGNPNPRVKQETP